ncbi:MAG TPA: hypothetical protein VG147_14655 [Solirubrobacteraceae bacterium]|jgi:hypothetical protein|nr:hypothetical protein [Solirubrobacteraceae bacterium]
MKLTQPLQVSCGAIGGCWKIGADVAATRVYLKAKIARGADDGLSFATKT